MSRSKPPHQQPAGVIVVRQSGDHGWVFGYPRISDEVDAELENAIDCMRCDPAAAKRILRRLIRDYPEHLDAYYHLALTWYHQGNLARAAAVWEAGTELALKFFPPGFSMKRARLEWGMLSNRPFLRLYHGYGLSLMRTGQIEPALEVFSNIVRLNPNDNQGARGLVVECSFALKRPKAVLALCNRYPSDAMEHLVYGLPLALFQLGRLPRAATAMRRALNLFPRIGEALLRSSHRPPKDLDEQRIRMGGADQAYLYWRDQGRSWRETPGALEFLRSALEKIAIRKEG